MSKGLSEELDGHTGASFEQPWGITFDVSGNLFVADPFGRAGKSIVDKFDSAGTFQAQLGETALNETEFVRNAPVSDEGGHIYAADSNFTEVFVLGTAGEDLSQWTGANTPAKTFGAGCCFAYAAIDNSSSVSKGDVYVMTTREGGEVDALRPKNGDKEEGEFVRRLEAPGGFAFGNEVGLAVNDANGQVYVADSGHNVVDRFSAAGEFEAAAQIKGPSVNAPIAVAVDGATSNVFVFEAGAQKIDEFSPTGELLNQITEAGPSEALVGLRGLAVESSGPHAGYLYASDIAKQRIDVFAPGVLEPPTIAGLAVREVSGDSAGFAAEINPQGASTTYHFEYGRCSTPSTCASSPYEHALSKAALSAEDFSVHTTAAVSVQGLSEETTYHLRVVVHNANGESMDERAFTTQGPGGTLQLPDGRAFELVSPPDKHAAAVEGAGEVGVVQAAADGSAITYLANAPTESGPEGNAAGVQVLSRRTSGGWSSKDLATPHETATGNSAGTAPEYRYFSEDLSIAIVQPFGLFNPVLSVEASEQTPYLRTLIGCESSCYRPLVTSKAPFANVEGAGFGEEALCRENNGIHGIAETVCGPRLLGGSTDASNFVLRSAASLVSGVPRSELYQWSAGHLGLISILPPNDKGEELPASTGLGEHEQPLLGSGFGIAKGTARHAISSDGSRVFWESEGALYVRDLAKGKSLQIDAPEPACLAEGKCESGTGRFQIASADGSRVYFTDANRLTKHAGAAAKEPDLYECKITEAAGKLACELSELTPSEAGKGANVQGDVLGASEDGSTVYLVADGALGTGGERGTCANNGENEPQPPGSRCNLLALHDGAVSLVARLTGGDAKDWTQSTEYQPTRVSPNGQWLAFMSSRSLTGYDNRDTLSAKPDAEAFLYDSAGSGSLVCASCNPSGSRPAGVEYGQLALKASEALPAVRGEWESTGWVAALFPHTTAIGFSEPAYQPRYLNDSGRLFFNSLDALVPQDVNEIGDVYEYEPTGVGGCAASLGCVGLISSGTSPEVSTLLDASASGDDVFFLSAQQLTSDDIDAREDVYDAHACSASWPCISPAAKPPPPCGGEASCRSLQTTQPGVFSVPPSATYSGPANPTPPPPAPPAKPKPPTKVHLLAKAIRRCKTRYPHAKQRRGSCERQAHKRYGTKQAKTGAKSVKGKKSAQGTGR